MKKDDPAHVAEIGFKAMMEGDGDVVTGWYNKLQSAIANIIPAGALASQHRKMTDRVLESRRVCDVREGLDSMKKTTVSYAAGFHVLTGDDHSQAASMVIAPGEKEGSADNRHSGADQWLYVESGVGEATVNGQIYELKGGTLVLIQRGDRHEIRNVGQSDLRTLNFYIPPAYTTDGEELLPAKAK